MLPVLVDGAGGCALDVATEHPDGVGPGVIASKMGITVRRVMQLGVRALVKAQVANVLLEHANELHSKLPEGAVVEAVLHRGSATNAHCVIITTVVAIPKLPRAPKLAAAFHVDTEAVGNDEMAPRLTREERTRMHVATSTLDRAAHAFRLQNVARRARRALVKGKRARASVDTLAGSTSDAPHDLQTWGPEEVFRETSKIDESAPPQTENHRDSEGNPRK